MNKLGQNGMAYDKGLAERLDDYFRNRPDVEVKRMFGGLCYMVGNRMCCGIVGEALMARVGPGNYGECLKLPHVREMDFTGRPLGGFVYVEPEGFSSDEALAEWVGRCEAFVRSLPPKIPKHLL